MVDTWTNRLVRDVSLKMIPILADFAPTEDQLNRLVSMPVGGDEYDAELANKAVRVFFWRHAELSPRPLRILEDVRRLVAYICREFPLNAWSE